MFKKILWTIKKRGFITFLKAVFYFIKIFFSKLINKKYIKKKIYNFEMILDVYDKGLSRTLLLFGEREIEQKYIIEKILKPETVVLDLGSNIGYYALVFLSKINKKNIILVEPSPSNFDLLIKNLKLNNYFDIEMHMAAISNVDSNKEFYLSEMSNLNSFHVDLEDQEKFEKINVKTYTINSLIKDRRVDLIRMDVEGHEVSIFKSLINYIQKNNHKPSILYEPHMSKYNKENDIVEQLEILFSLGYKLNVAASSSIDGKVKFSIRNYESIKSFKTDEKQRDIFINISNKDALKLLGKEGGIRTALLSCNDEYLRFS